MFSREGKVLDIFVGKKCGLELSELMKLPVEKGYYSKRRLVKSSFSSTISERDLLLLKKLRLDCLVVLCGDRGRTAVMRLPPGSEERFNFIELDTRERNIGFYDLIMSYEEELSRFRDENNIGNRGSRALLVGCGVESDSDINYYLEELKALLSTLNIESVHSVWQKREPEASFLIGRGKIEEIRYLSELYECDIIVFFNTLTPVQKRNIEDETSLKIYDRNQIILDIFAKRARSNEGKLQVELAYLKYQLPRLTERDAGLSRLVGGFKTKGPGETKLEVMRRRYKDRIAELSQKIAELRRRRDFTREKRRLSNLPQVAIVGYTNAGKSTLLNRLTGSDVYVEDKLFATLDPTIRRFTYSDGFSILFSDTVGFIKNLPEELRSAFMATFEEIKSADLIIHLADISNPDVQFHIEAVEEILTELSLDHIPRFLVLNKSDRRDKINPILKRSDGIYISALTGYGLELLLDKIRRHFLP
ncbi:MAG: GTPase HflX [Myxococcota bacterium]